MIAVSLASAASADLPTPNDPRVGLSAGEENAGTAAKGMELLAHLNKPAGFRDPNNPGSIAFANSDLAFQGDYAFVGNFNGFNIYNVSNPNQPVLRTSVVCPGGQGDLSVYGNLLFMSVEENRAKVDCTLDPPATAETRFRGVRVFDISNLDNPVQVAAVQTCRGSHTHTLVTGKSRSKVWIYVQGTAGVRPPTELAGCNTTADPTQPNPSRWRIEVIEVPLAAPQTAQVVNEPRLFTDPTTGRIDGLQNQPQTPLHPSGTAWSPTPTTDSCHDITVYPQIGLAAGACEGNGLLIDIKDPANPKRIDAVADPLFAYWHGATFSNDGKTVMFTDEWGGGVGPRCRATDDLSWGANAIYDIVKGKLKFRSYYKLPVVQTDQENCVSHIPSLVPVPGRDIFVQAWYQGGASLVDFTDSSNPVEIGYFDRGPFSATALVLSGFWSTYWYNGVTYGSEIGRGLDALGLTPTAQLSANEIAAAREVIVKRLNVQHQDKLRWDPSFAVVRSYVDQLNRLDLKPSDASRLAKAEQHIDKAEQLWEGRTNKAARAQLVVAAALLPRSDQFDDLRDALIDLARS
jgi:LVIVD repeat-containing protein